MVLMCLAWPSHFARGADQYSRPAQPVRETRPANRSRCIFWSVTYMRKAKKLQKGDVRGGWERRFFFFFVVKRKRK